MVEDNLPDHANVSANHEHRILLLEHDVAVLQGRVPKSKTRRVFWFLIHFLVVAVPIVGGTAALFGKDPWRDPIVFGAFGVLVGRSLTDLFLRVAQGTYPHRSLLLNDYR